MPNRHYISKRSLRLIILLMSISTIVIYFNVNLISKFDWDISLNETSEYPYVALIVDDRATELLVNAVINVLQHIPADWKVQIITLPQHWPFYTNSSLASFIQSNRVFLTPLGQSRGNLSSGDYINAILTSESFWRQVQGDKVLLFQIDSVICSNSSHKLTDFLQYDYIGAPWDGGGCCNGGLSLRSRIKMLKLIISGRVPYRLHDLNEDQWFTKHLRFFNGNIAPVSVAKTFSVESIYHPGSFAVHKPYFPSLGPKNMHRLCEECPEVRRITSHCPSTLKTNTEND